MSISTDNLTCFRPLQTYYSSNYYTYSSIVYG